MSFPPAHNTWHSAVMAIAFHKHSEFNLVLHTFTILIIASLHFGIEWHQIRLRMIPHL